MKVISLLDEEAIIDALKSYIYSALNNNWDTKSGKFMFNNKIIFPPRWEDVWWR